MSRHGRAHRMALDLRRRRPRTSPGRPRGGSVDAALLQTLAHLRADAARLRDAGEVALDVGHEHRHACAAEALGERLQRHRLAGAGGAGDQAVAVRHLGQQEAFDAVVLGEQDRVGHPGFRSASGSRLGRLAASLSNYTKGTRDRRGAAERAIMAGHSKWANIQHRKGRQDEKRGKVWTRLIREIVVAARHGGGDLSMNPRLRLAVEKAKAANMPADTIKKNIDKATGNLEGMSYEEVRYEGYGMGGAAIIVDCMTDNRVRTVAEVRHALQQVRRQPRRRRLGRVPVQALRPVRVRTGHQRGQGDGGRRSTPAPTT